ncbi:Putative glutaredoxin [Nocardioides dokdonensis FR1436]|uniref:Putative glutaredoxin n=1 Tax=Nocardioides dokdonensis FR1436 TaxID=1300347 RepID=A0A1A9GR01_9ACTN|nr:glutaredoxin domain-containing protein [Nocardioides dokdonensis]ANH39881.1 Putative glutaredoxin [Nocardioides dokdonensis FR1436]
MGRWGGSAALLVAAGVMLGNEPGVGSILAAVLLAVFAFLLSPLLFPSSPGDLAGRRRGREEGVPVVYWRPGCHYCLKLRLGLLLLRQRVIWVDISKDPDASARVRSVNGGNETVPTVFSRGSVKANPSLAWVREQRAAR